MNCCYLIEVRETEPGIDSTLIKYGTILKKFEGDSKYLLSIDSKSPDSVISKLSEEPFVLKIHPDENKVLKNYPAFELFFNGCMGMLH